MVNLWLVCVYCIINVCVLYGHGVGMLLILCVVCVIVLGVSCNYCVFVVRILYG